MRLVLVRLARSIPLPLYKCMFAVALSSFVEYHQEMMGDTWDKWNASDSWEDFINETGKLKACLEEHK